MKHGFTSWTFNQNCIKNRDEKYFIVNLDDERTSGIMSDISVKHVDVEFGE